MNSKQAAGALLAAYDGATRLVPPTDQDPAFDVDAAYAVADDIRSRRIARGEKPRGYKIGFINRSIWPRYGVYGPIWGPIWDSTVTELAGPEGVASLASLVQPRLEPEIMFGFARPPGVGLGTDELLGCIDWVAHGFEIVQTHFDDWRFRAADTVADFALHGRLFVGPRMSIVKFVSAQTELAAVAVELRRNGDAVDNGAGRAVLDGPLDALRIWLDAMQSQVHDWPIRAGDIVTTGTLTDAWPLVAGEHWETVLSDPRLPGLSLRIEA